MVVQPVGSLKLGDIKKFQEYGRLFFKHRTEDYRFEQISFVFQIKN